MKDDDGAGKTIFLNVLAGQIQPTSGERWLSLDTCLEWLRKALP